MDLNIIQIHIYASISTGDDTDKFYEDLEQAKVQSRQQDPLIIMGQFNAKVGERREENVVGPHGLKIRNIRGKKLVG